jgi:hypothetical protein
MNSQAPPSPTIVRYQSAVAFALLLLFCGVFATVDLLARSGPVARWFNQRNLAETKRNHGHFARYDQFFDKIDYLWMRKLEQADYSKGGVELFGSSVAICSLRDWALPTDQAALVHNYGYSGANMVNTSHFIRYLIDHKGLLDAGPEKSLFVLGLTYADIGNSLDTRNYFQESILRSGLYEYDLENGIMPVQVSPVQRLVKSEEMRCRSFLMALNSLWPNSEEQTNPAQFRKISVKRMGDRWPILLEAQLRAEAGLLRDLKMRRVHVVGVLLPEGSWNEGIPAHDQFMVQIHNLFADESLPLIDYTTIVPDNEFCDSLHPDMKGEPIIHGVLMKLALDFLHQSGALPSGSTYLPL